MSKDIFKSALYEIVHDKRAVFCVILDSRGSSPRGIGAKLLVKSTGDVSGSVGGGIAEYRCIMLAKELLAEGESCIKEFSLHDGDDGIGMICGGSITVGFYVFDKKDESLLSSVTENSGSCLIIRSEDFKKLQIEVTEKSIGGSCLQDGPVIVKTDTGFIYSEPITNDERCVVFGAGHVSRALVPLLKSLDFRVDVYDDRASEVKYEYFTMADSVSRADYSLAGDHVADKDYAVVLTHGHESDFEVLKQLTERDLSYIGCIGSRKKAAIINSKLSDIGISEEKIKRIHSPIGLNIGGKTPAEIAVSIAAEIIQVRNTK